MLEYLYYSSITFDYLFVMPTYLFYSSITLENLFVMPEYFNCEALHFITYL